MKTVELAEAVAIVEAGGVVAAATDTLVGLLALAEDAKAVARVVEIKGVERRAPIPVLVRDLEMVGDFTDDVGERALALAREGWSGPLTLVIRCRSGAFPPAVTAGGETVGFRAPGPSPARQLIDAVGRPLTGTSANVTGQAPTAATVGLAGAIADAVDGVLSSRGFTGSGQASRVVDVTGESVVVIRDGGVRPARRER